MLTPDTEQGLPILRSRPVGLYDIERIGGCGQLIILPTVSGHFINHSKLITKFKRNDCKKRKN